jgi:prepilin-type N-terminal cleavage/methylation domain-containing protein
MILRKNKKGFSLPEVMTVVAIIGIMSSIAVPSMFSWLGNKGVQSASRDLYSNMRKAQSFAVKRNRNCAITFNETVNGVTYDYVVYVDEDKDFSYDAGETVIAQVQWSQYRNAQLTSVNFANNASGDSTIAFQPNLIPADYDGGFANGTVKLKNTGSLQFDVVVSASGSIALKKQ